MSVPRLVRIPFLLLTLVLAPLAAWGQAPACTTQGTVITTSGPVCGLVAGGVSKYLGIPYAQAQRWQAPQAPQSWTSTFQATQLGSICPQPASPSPPKSGCFVPAQSEDCLNLNVWVPPGASPTTPVPVMVFIHGGAFLIGSGESSVYDGTALATAGNVIVVTLNYRLGALGFLVQNAADTNATNFGFRDQIAALQWVQKNIKAFGGDPTNVTIFGESAGAMSVGLHALSSSQSEGLFKAALMESNPLGIAYMTMSQAANLGSAFVSQLPCTGPSTQQCLQNLTFSTIINTEETFTQKLLTTGIASLPFAPVIDGTLFTQQPMAAADAGNLKVPMLLGTNQNEGYVFGAMIALDNGMTVSPTLYNEFLKNLVGSGNVAAVQNNPAYTCTSGGCATQMAQVVTDSVFACANRHLAGAAPGMTYAYAFSQVNCNPWGLVAPACSLLTCHAAELPYVFNNTGTCEKCTFGKFGPKLSNAIQSYWTSFAKTQSPSGPVAWPPFGSDKSYMVLHQGESIQNDYWNTQANQANCAFWENIKFEQSSLWDRVLPALLSKMEK